MSGRRSVCCWGAQLLGDEADAKPCAPGFVIGKRHFKSKFCSVHRQNMWLPADRLRTLPDALANTVVNNRSGGVWNVMKLPMGAGDARYRVINNTDGCYLPRLIVFEEAPPAHLPWAPLPAGLVTDDEGHVQLSVAKGTVVPTFEERASWGRERQRTTAPSSAQASSSPPSPSPPSSPSPPPSPILEPSVLEEALNYAMVPAPESPSPSPIEPPTPTTVLVPSVLMKLKGTPRRPSRAETPPPLSTDSDSPSFEEMTAEEKAQRRMARNRASAAVSRERKRKYVEELEEMVSQLEGQVVALYEENRLWQSLELPPLDDGTFFNAVCDIYYQ